jgi:RNA recognition motif-containing protein
LKGLVADHPFSHFQNSVFVSRLPVVDNVEECLHGLFAEDGQIRHLRVMLSKQLPPNKFAFVTFEDSSATQRALDRNGQVFMEKILIVREKEREGWCVCDKRGLKYTYSQFF